MFSLLRIHPEADELAILRQLCLEVLPNTGSQIRCHDDLADPWSLTWCHKAIISSEFIANNDGRYSHFVYLEGDIRLSLTNFCYWIEFRQLLRS